MLDQIQQSLSDVPWQEREIHVIPVLSVVPFSGGLLFPDGVWNTGDGAATIAFIMLDFQGLD